MYQSLVEGREVPWALLVKDMPKEKHRDLDWIVDQIDWEANVDPNFKANHYLEPIPVADISKDGWIDKWIVYGKVRGEQFFSARELTVQPGVKCTIKDRGASSIIVVQGEGRLNKLRLSSPKMIGLHHRAGRPRGRDVRKHFRHRAAGRAAIFRAGSESGCTGIEVCRECEVVGWALPAFVTFLRRAEARHAFVERTPCRTTFQNFTTPPGRDSSAKGRTPSQPSAWRRCST
jgi:hypothetical protein